MHISIFVRRVVRTCDRGTMTLFVSTVAPSGQTNSGLHGVARLTAQSGATVGGIGLQRMGTNLVQHSPLDTGILSLKDRSWQEHGHETATRSIISLHPVGATSLE